MICLKNLKQPVFLLNVSTLIYGVKCKRVLSASLFNST